MIRAYRAAAFAAIFDLCLALSAPAFAADAEAPAAAAPAATPVTGGEAAAPATAAPAMAQPPTDAAPPTGVAPAAPTTQATQAGDQGVVIGFVKHTKPPALIDSTPGKAAFGMIGAAASISAGNDIVGMNDIQDPSGDMTHELAVAYAAAHGGRVADAPLLDAHKWTRVKGTDVAAEAAGARYVIDVDSPGMTLIYFSFDWTHFDLMFMATARVIDTSDGAVISKAHCFIKTDKSQAQTHADLLADHAAKLKALIVSKSEACTAVLKTGLKL